MQPLGRVAHRAGARGWAARRAEGSVRSGDHCRGGGQVQFQRPPGEIKAPTLVAQAWKTLLQRELFRETAEGIPNARLALYPRVGHPASGKQFERDVLAFLREGIAQRPASNMGEVSSIQFSFRGTHPRAFLATEALSKGY